jgi:hypothetical protein
MGKHDSARTSSAGSDELPADIQPLLGFNGMTSVLRQEGRTETATPLLLKKDIEKGVVDADLAVVFNESQFPEAIHEKTHSGPSCADHVSQ